MRQKSALSMKEYSSIVSNELVVSLQWSQLSSITTQVFNFNKLPAGPTVLEVFNTLLKHLRMSVDFELGESSRRNSSTSVSSGRGKESEERIVQNAIIQTIGQHAFYCLYYYRVK